MKQHVMYFRYFMWSYIMLFSFILIVSINIQKIFDVNSFFIGLAIHLNL